MATTKALTFKPKQLTKKLLGSLHERANDVLSSRFGLNADYERKTLEAIGKKYGITRERVRQIENAALSSIRKSDAFKSEQPSFEELKEFISDLGAVVSEKELLDLVSKDKNTQNHILFYLVLGDQFKKHKEDEFFSDRWSIDTGIADDIHTALKNIYTNLSDDELLPESEMIEKFLEQIKHLSEKYKNEEMAKRWLLLSKNIGKNPLSEWGKSASSNVKTRGVKDYAYLVMRKHGSPMHFREVAKSIQETFGKKTHVATCHNELIKDSRFVLVGRGVYALKEWGYTPGVVKEVIKSILDKNGPMTKEDIVEKVLKERYLKKNTILVNLQNPKYFKKTKDGKYDNN
jgi:hypothetical protein